MTYSAVELLGERETIEKNIEDKLREAISPYGIVLDDVLVKDIDMPAMVLQAIEAKAKADQVAKQTTADGPIVKIQEYRGDEGAGGLAECEDHYYGWEDNDGK